jgi:anti-anti-sigma factor
MEALVPADRAEFRIVADTAVVIGHGEFDLATADILGDALQKACGSGKDVELEASDIEFMDASALRHLVRAADTLREQSLRLRVRKAQPIVHRLLTLTGLEHLLVDDPGEQ